MPNVGGIPELHIQRGATTYLSANLSPEEIDLIDGRTGLWFTVKEQLDDSDEDAILQIQEGVGLVRLNGVQPSNSSWASITINEIVIPPNPPTIEMIIHAAATQHLTSWNSYLYHDLQLREEGVIVGFGFGRTYIVRDRTRVV